MADGRRQSETLPSVFFWLIGKKRWLPQPLIGWNIFDFSSKSAKWNSRKLDRKHDLNVFYQVCVLRDDPKTRWLPRPLIGWDIFDFSFETADQNSTKLDRMQDLNILYQVRVFRVNQKIKIAALASDWLRHFQIRLINSDIFDFLFETAEQNSRKLDRKQNLNILWQVCVFQADWNCSHC